MNNEQQIKDEIRKAIQEHLVIENPQSIHYSVDRIFDKIVKPIINIKTT